MTYFNSVTKEALSYDARKELSALMESAEKTSFNDTYVSALAEITKSPEKMRSIGPIFEITDKYGTKLRVSVVRVANNRMSKPGDPVKERMIYFLIAEDENGIPVGIKRSFVDESEDGSEYIVKGFIESGQRGKGVSTSLELANILYLQSESAKNKKPYEIKMVNRNDEDLKQMQSEFENDSNPILVEILKRKQEENNRWHAVYGVEGKLGLDNEGKRRIIGEPEQAFNDGELVTVDKVFSHPKVAVQRQLSDDEFTGMMERWAAYSQQVAPAIESEQAEFQARYEKLVRSANELQVR